jgi:hypothetical protein
MLYTRKRKLDIARQAGIHGLPSRNLPDKKAGMNCFIPAPALQ